MNGILGKKIGMTQIYREDGTAIPVTVLRANLDLLEKLSPERKAAEQKASSALNQAKPALRLRFGRQLKSSPCSPGTFRIEARSARSFSMVSWSTVFTAKSGLVESRKQL